MYKCEILGDSLSPQKERLTTMKIIFPRFILAEMNTHRMFSRNSASSRAIPFNKMVKMVEENPFIPIAWQKSHSGMQGTEYFTNDDLMENLLIQNWLRARDNAIHVATSMNNSSLTKQLCNRLLEPFMWHTVIITSSEFENFFKLRCPNILHQANGKYYRSLKDWNNVDKEIQWTGLTCLHPENKSQAEIHIQAIAELMWDEFNSSTPKQLSSGQWHIPFGDNIDNETLGNILYPKIPLPHNIIDYDKEKVKIATARCARISYETLGDNPKIDYEADIRLHDRLLAEGHMSPFEHCARAMSDEEYESFIKGKITNYEGGSISYEGIGWCNNFKGFIQYRYMIENNYE